MIIILYDPWDYSPAAKIAITTATVRTMKVVQKQACLPKPRLSRLSIVKYNFSPLFEKNNCNC